MIGESGTQQAKRKSVTSADAATLFATLAQGMVAILNKFDSVICCHRLLT